MVGWIQIEGTSIDYPVMQTPADPTYYLKHDFEKNYTDYGCPFMQADCDALAPSDNLIIYGHNMKDGSMFGGLKKFKDREYFEEHGSFELLTPGGDYKLTAVAVLVIEPTDVLYNPCIEDETAAEAWVSRVVSEANFCTRKELAADGHYVMLSTCSTPDRNLRDVVIARVEV